MLRARNAPVWEAGVSHDLDGYLSGFVGAMVVTIAAFLLDRVRSAPPFLALLLAAFWLLVPGVLAVPGLAELMGSDATVAGADIGSATLAPLPACAGCTGVIGRPTTCWMRMRYFVEPLATHRAPNCRWISRVGIRPG